MTKTIDLTKVPENPSVFSILTPREEVAAIMQYLTDEVSHIEWGTKSTYTVEMSSGDFVTIPKEALISR